MLTQPLWATQLQIHQQQNVPNGKQATHSKWVTHLVVDCKGAKGVQAVCAASRAYHIVAAASTAVEVGGWTGDACWELATVSCTC